METRGSMVIRHFIFPALDFLNLGLVVLIIKWVQLQFLIFCRPGFSDFIIPLIMQDAVKLTEELL